MNRKFIIYQVLPRLFGNTNDVCIPNSFSETNGCGKLADFTNDVILSIKDLGCTHIWFTGILEHATQTDHSSIGAPPDPHSVVKGKAGSPYAIKDYYDISPDLALVPEKRLEEFSELANRCHKLGVKVLIDYVPNHISRVYASDSNPGRVGEFGANDDNSVAFHPSNNFYYIPGKDFIPPEHTSDTYTEYPAKATGNDCFKENPSSNDWYDTVKLNYGVNYQNGIKYFDPIPDTWVKMTDILLYWCEKGVDGFRCDMAEMVPVEFWEYAISIIKKSYPYTLFIAEIYRPDLYHAYLDAGFDNLYDKVGLYDTLKKIVLGTLPASEITRCWQSLSGIQDKMLNFLENHDEQRIASPYFAGDPLKALPAFAVSLLLNRAPFMIYSGQELGEKGMDNEGYSSADGRTSIFDYWSVETIRNWLNDKYDSHLRDRYRILLNLALTESAFHSGDSFDLQYANQSNSCYNPDILFSFVRKLGQELIIVIVNFSKTAVSAKLILPAHMFEFFGISDGIELPAVNLVTGKDESIVLGSSVPIDLKVPEYGCIILKLLLQ